MLNIVSVDPGSVGEELGLCAGDKIECFDGGGSADILDYLYFENAESFTLTVRKKKDGRRTVYEVSKYAEESLGLSFGDSAQLTPRACANKCLFCFVDQLPKGLRGSLYIKDDDYRLSLVTGSFVTLTNLSRYDLKRITERRFSPLYISVHAADDTVRRTLLGSPKAPPVIPLMRTLADAGIRMHAQAVLVPGINDGEVLKDTLLQLSALRPALLSFAAVPVGVTHFREGLAGLKPLDAQSAREAAALCRAFGEGFAECSDELYLRAGLPLPPYEAYGDFPQIENGVGLMRKFEREFDEVFDTPVRPDPARRVLVATGESALPFMTALTERFNARFGTAHSVCAIPNRLFGASVTVSGLMCGADIAAALKGKVSGFQVAVPDCALKYGEHLFLDNMDITSLENRLGAPVTVCENTGYSFFDLLAEA